VAFGEPEQRPQCDEGSGQAVPAQWLEHGAHVVLGDLAQLSAGG
jgi:hypothetical protein